MNKIPATSLLFGCSMLAVVLASGGVRAGDAVELSTSLAFTPITLPTAPLERLTYKATSSAIVDGEMLAIGYQPIIRPGDELDGVIFGQLVDVNGVPMVDETGAPNICNKPDSTTLLRGGDNLFMLNHFECTPGAMYLTELSQDPTNGQLTAVSTKPIDFSGVSGGVRHCAGMLTPWGTHIGSSEESYDARAVQADGSLDDEDWKTMSAYLGEATPSPYLWGWAPEVAVLNADGDTDVTNHYAMGRLKLELAYVLPDERSVYLSEDSTNSPLGLFVADTPRDLSAGTIYAARFTQTDNEGGGAGDLQWINLGHATNDDVAMLLADGITFDQIFDTASPNEDGSCPADFTSINAEFKHECLALKPGMELAASHLETGRYAAMMGATTEFSKMEGGTFDADSNRYYVAMSRIERGMLDGDEKYDLGGSNDVRLDANKCGVVYALDPASDQVDTDGAAIDSSYAFTSMYSLLEGSPRKYRESGLDANGCDVNGMANPDNITYLDGSGVLIIAEDSGQHINNMLWAYDVVSGSLSRLQTAAYGAEMTGTYWFGDVNGWGYLSNVIQKGLADEEDIVTDAEMALITDDMRRATVGIIGPFPALTR